MSFAEWLNLIRAAEKSSIISGNLRKVHYTFPDGREMVEEYSLETGIIQRRAWRKKQDLRGEPDWEIELGDCVKDLRMGGEFLLKESNTEVNEFFICFAINMVSGHLLSLLLLIILPWNVIIFPECVNKGENS